MSIGVKKIKIPIKPKELTIEAIKPYLKDVFQQFAKNQKKITENYEIYLGGHNVLNKKRPYSSDKINHKVVEPHLYSMVNFKCGYALGNPKEYAQREGVNTEDIIYLNKYIKDCDLRSVDDEVLKWVYATGVGYYFIQPKSIIEDSESKSPFEVFCQTPDTCTKVYSSYLGEEALFDVLVYNIAEKKNGAEIKYTLLSIYLPDYYVEFKNNGVLNSEFEIVRIEKRGLYKMLPLVEMCANTDRLGIVEVGKSLQDAIDDITSSSLDNIDDVVNLLYVFINVSLGETPEEKQRTFARLKENGVVELLPSNPQFPADLKTLAVNLNHTDIDTVYKQLKDALYGCEGVPLPTASVGSGNNAAAETGAGWANAYTVMLKDINTLLKGDNALLERMLFISKNIENPKITKLNASDVETKYNINRSENLLIKAQAWDYFKDVPPALKTKWIGISNEPDLAGKIIEEYQAKMREQQNNVVESNNS